MAGSSSRPSPTLTLLKLFVVLVTTGVLVAAVFIPYLGGIGLVGNSQAEKFLNQTCTLQESAVPQRTTVYASDGKTAIASIFLQDRVPVPLTAVPQALQDALVATEDRRFYSHHGVDMRGLLRSAVSTSNGSTQGGSTLTMQYVKQERYYQATTDAGRAAAINQNLTRKIEDAKCALDIETRESKPTILDNYLNIAFFGENSYGIATAAQTYFSKPVSQLDLAQSAMLVGLLQAPTEYDPFGNNGQNAAATLRRRNQVIQNLVDVGKLTAASAAKWEAYPLELGSTSAPTVQQGCAGTESTAAVVHNAGFFCDYLINYWLPTVGGLTTKQIDEGGLKIISSLSVNDQNVAQNALAKISPSSPTTAIMPELDPSNGRILAMATSKEFGLTPDGGHTTVPVFTQDTTGAASTFKLFPMLAALAVGAQPTLTFGANDPTGNGDLTFTPTACGGSTTAFHNSGSTGFLRNENMAGAVAKSSNTYFIALEDEFFSGCDLQPEVSMALSLGMNSLNNRNSAGANAQTAAQLIVQQQRATFTLGQDNTDPLEVAGAYAAVANNGTYCKPVPVISITASDGAPVPVKGLTGNCTPVIAPQVAHTAQQLLLGDTKPGGGGTSEQAFASWYSGNASPISGKTGTNNASDSHGNQLNSNSSVWFAGITPGVAAVTALMNLNSASAPLSGLPGLSKAAAGQVMGPYASALWLSALQPVLQERGSWNWPSENDVSNGVPVPSVLGRTASDAQKELTGAGYKVVQAGAGQPYCASADYPPNVVAYQAPTFAPPGSTITFCVASYTPPTVFTPPPPPPPPAPPAPPALPAPSAGNSGPNLPTAGTAPTSASTPTQSSVPGLPSVPSSRHGAPTGAPTHPPGH